MGKRILLAAVLGGLTLFAWGAVSHLWLQIEDGGLRAVPPPPGDEPLMEILRNTLTEDAVYLAPGGDWERRNEPAVHEEWEKRWNAGPRAFIAVSHQPFDMGKSLVVEVVMNLMAALIVAFLMSLAIGRLPSLVGRTLFASAIGLVANLRTIENANWWGFACNYTGLQALDLVIGFTLMGFVIALIMKPPKPA
jgi:hypothetical protein